MKFFVITSFLLVAANCLERTKIEDNGIYKLQNQHDGRFLTAGTSGTPSRQEWSGRANQKFKFTITSRTKDGEAWTLTPVDDIGALVPKWQLTYVGHGKTQFKNLSSGMCLIAQGTGQVGEGECNRDDPRQRWYVDYTTVEAKP